MKIYLTNNNKMVKQIKQTRTISIKIQNEDQLHEFVQLAFKHTAYFEVTTNDN